MNFFIYLMIFIGGTIFGSFFSLAIYRIPRKENITYVQSHCTSCNHKLGPKDLIPILSYLFLRGRCRYCKEKIRNRYVLLEINTGITFLLIALFMRINIFSTILDFINLFIIYLFVVAMYIIGGINKENNSIPDSLILYAIVIACLKIFLNGFQGINIISNLLGFLIIPLSLIILGHVLNFDKKKEFPISFSDIKYLAVLGLFFGLELQLIIVLIMLVLKFILNRKKQIPLGYYMSIVSVLITIFNNQFLEIKNLIWR